MITRDELVEQSVTNFVRGILDSKGYTDEHVELLESFPTRGIEGPLQKTYVALGFNFDDHGKQGELGSDLMVRVYTIEFFIFGLDRIWGKNVANLIKFALDSDGRTVPLLDLENDNEEIDRLVVLGASTDRQIVPDPEPWQEYVWLTTTNIEDTYSAALP